jgi:hypothetical protein
MQYAYSFLNGLILLEYKDSKIITTKPNKIKKPPEI